MHIRINSFPYKQSKSVQKTTPVMEWFTCIYQNKKHSDIHSLSTFLRSYELDQVQGIKKSILSQPSRQPLWNLIFLYIHYIVTLKPDIHLLSMGIIGSLKVIARR